ncbi:MAG TPA: NAD-dependent epimerase/dehydratase family protein [Longimicrobiaceae bacterium]|jgi:nucleoside-diphosphate-sugar epimerase|nr:NAD-dependent epimerase/dehydratase family protein [Longimicrobiaceae bacterium]
MRVFMTGASGYIGGVVAERLRAAGHEVRGLARNDDAAGRLRTMGIEPVRGTLLDRDVIAQEVREADAFIHTAMDMTRRVVEADLTTIEAALEGIGGSGKRFIYTSGTAVVGDTGDGVSDEETPIDPASIVAWRGDHEKRVTGGGGILIRPALVYGRGGSGIVTMQIAEARRDGVVHYVGNGSQRWSGVHVDDLADLYLLALENARPGSLYVAAAGEPVSMLDIAEAASRAGGAGGRTAPLTRDEAQKALGWMAGLVSVSSAASGERARRELGWSPHRPALLEELAHGSYVAVAA